MPAETPTIVLVHGAWADATGFDAEIAPCSVKDSASLDSLTRFVISLVTPRQGPQELGRRAPLKASWTGSGRSVTPKITAHIGTWLNSIGCT